ncbi:MAG: YfdX family protein [Proteobacteria bacterium]|nr:YfdX family protein [Pseudomonadota bacterium]
MKSIIVKTIVTIFSILFLATGSAMFAADKEKTATPEVQSKSAREVQPAVDAKTDEKVAEQRKKILSQATVAIEESRKALKALDEGKTEEAIKNLELATGKMALIVARDPELSLANVDIKVKVFDVFANAETLEATVKRATKYLEDGEVQLARPLVASLASEMVIESVNIPLATYPEAIKDIVPLIDKGKIKEAKAALQAALNTLVVINEGVIPLPVMRAKAMLKEAEKLAETKERKEEDNKKLATFLDNTETQLKIAEILGYGDKKAFKPMYEQLDTIREKTKDGKSGTGFFDKLTEQVFKNFQLTP